MTQGQAGPQVRLTFSSVFLLLLSTDADENNYVRYYIREIRHVLLLDRHDSFDV